MPQHMIAMVYALVAAMAALIFFRPAFSRAIGRERYDNWLIAWVSVTILIYLFPKFWTFMPIALLVAWFLAKRDAVAPAMFVFLLGSAPPFSVTIPGFGIVSYLTYVSVQILYAAVLLLPMMLIPGKLKKVGKAGGVTDAFVLIWLLMSIGLAVRAPSVTHMLRVGVDEFIALAPIYYVFSRYPKALEDIRVLTAAFIAPVLGLSSVAIMEVVTNWHFYDPVVDFWPTSLSLAYKVRDGILRASTSVLNPISWGFVAMVAIGMSLAFVNERIKGIYRLAAFGLLGIGLILSLSRGPWIGAGVTVFFFILFGPKALPRIGQLSLAGGIALLASLATPFGQRIVGMLPIIGDSSADTINYRRRLLDVSWEVIMEKPFLGHENPLAHPDMQVLRQGEGIIDIVNSYIYILLFNGFLGLIIYLGIFCSAIAGLHKAMRKTQYSNPQLSLYCRAMLATLLGIMFTIFTTSSVDPIPIYIWAFIGLSVSLCRLAVLQPDGGPDPIAQKTALPIGEPAFNWK